MSQSDGHMQKIVFEASISHFFFEKSLIFIRSLGVTSVFNCSDIDKKKFLAWVEEKIGRNFRVNREMRDEILVYEPFLMKF